MRCSDNIGTRLWNQKTRSWTVPMHSLSASQFASTNNNHRRFTVSSFSQFIFSFLRVPSVRRSNKPNSPRLNVSANIFYKPVSIFLRNRSMQAMILTSLGELNEHLLAETREQFFLRYSIIDDEDIAEWGSYVEPNAKPGSIQRKQLYKKAVRDHSSWTTDGTDQSLHCTRWCPSLFPPLIPRTSLFTRSMVNWPRR